MNSESSQKTDQHIRLLGPGRKESDEEVRKRAQAQREARREPILRWRDLPWEIFQVVEVKETKSQFGDGMILTLERRGVKTKVWACSRLIREMRRISREKWHLLKIDNYGMKKAKKSGHDYFDFEVVI